MQCKKGVSAVVATVLIIMITVAAIGIIWGAVMPLVRNSLDSSISEDVELSIETSEGYTVYDPDTKILQVQISRGQDDANISKLEVRVEIDGRTLDPVICSPPEKNEMNLCSINLASYPGKITGISVIPIILKGKQELQGSVKQTAELPPNTPVSEGSFEIKGGVLPPGSPLSSETTNHLIGYWPFDTNFKDYSGNGNDGNPINQSKVENNTLLLDGDWDYVNMGDIGVVDSLKNFSIAAWIRLDATVLNNDSDIFSKGVHEFNQSILIWKDDFMGLSGPHHSKTKTLSVMFWDGATMLWIAASNNSLDDSDWHFMTVTLESGKSDGFKIFFNGSLESEGDASGFTGIFPNDYDFLVGAPKSNVGTTWNGEVDEVMIFDKVLTEAEIQELFNAGR